MPTVIVINGFRLYFYSNENNEPIHIHIQKGDGNGKWWIDPGLEEAYAYGFSSKERKQIELIVKENKDLIIERWNEFFG
ncbi:MAG: DUF4160 domain-containing protein [Cyclobacteriaceae bacterium]|nr:DUF4160 domain-containing protein [Cyclobacteriaceae bacterium]